MHVPMWSCFGGVVLFYTDEHNWDNKPFEAFWEVFSMKHLPLELLNSIVILLRDDHMFYKQNGFYHDWKDIYTQSLEVFVSCQFYH